MKTDAAAKSEDALRSKGAGAELRKMFKGFELYSIYFTSGLGGLIAGWVYLGPLVGEIVGLFIGGVLGIACGVSVLAKCR